MLDICMFSLPGRTIPLSVDPDVPEEKVAALLGYMGATASECSGVSAPGTQVRLRLRADGLCLEDGTQIMRADLAAHPARLKPANLNGELLVRAVRMKHSDRPLHVIDATAGLGEDALLLAAAGCTVWLYERNPVIAALLEDAVRRAAALPWLSDIVARMTVFPEDSITALPRLAQRPDVVFLDPMFPEKDKSSLTKKKFQLLHHLEMPCADEEALLQAALEAHPQRIVIKRPLKGPCLAGRRPSYTLTGKTVRYDCIQLSRPS